MFHQPTKFPIGFEEWTPKSRQSLILDEIHHLLDSVGYFKEKPKPREDKPYADDDHDLDAVTASAAAELKSRLDRRDRGKVDDEE